MINCQFQHYQGHRQGQPQGNGFQKIESFFSDIFGCGACNIVPSGMAAQHHSTERSYSSLRPLEDDRGDFYGTIPEPNDSQRSRSSERTEGYHANHHPSRQPAFAKPSAHKPNDVSFSSSLLNETGTTYPDSSFFDTSMSSSSHSRIIDDVIPSVPKADAQHYPRQPCMVPTERVVGIWPPQKQPEEPPENLFPVRPPKIRRMRLDDALGGDSMGSSSHNGTNIPNDGVPVPETVYRSRSLDFLCSGKRPRSQSRRNRSNDPKRHQPEQHRTVPSERWLEEFRRHHLANILSDLHETDVRSAAR